MRNNLSKFDFIEYKQGWIPGRFHKVIDKKISFVCIIDVDMYQSILDSVEFFYSRLLSGGIIFFDELIRDKNAFFLSLSSGHTLLIKK